MLFYEQRILAAADFLQNVVSINVQLMEEEKASSHHSIIVVICESSVTISCLLLTTCKAA